MYPGTCAQLNPPSIANAIVTAGFKCAPENLPTANAPIATAKPHPVAITIQSALLPALRFKLTLAQTPPPKSIRMAVPKNSAK
ncbi:Uncharacterised protein [Streptococcus pneumoniae]|nr:Uncharacterised protein [Streptococcus pneumoniae]